MHSTTSATWVSRHLDINMRLTIFSLCVAAASALHLPVVARASARHGMVRMDATDDRIQQMIDDNPIMLCAPARN